MGSRSKSLDLVSISILSSLIMSWPGLMVSCDSSSKSFLSLLLSCGALQVNLFFLLNIIRVLVTKLRDTHRAESNMYMKAVRATLILVPLLGIQFVIFPWRPENRLAGEVYEYIMHILMHYQVGRDCAVFVPSKPSRGPLINYC